MSTRDTSTATNRPTGGRSSPRLPTPLLMLIRGLWWLLLIWTLATGLLGLPALFDLYNSPVPLLLDIPNSFGLTPGTIAGLPRLGMTPNGYSAIIVGLLGFRALVEISVGLLIYRLRSDDWLSVLISALLLTVGFSLPASGFGPLADADPRWYLFVWPLTAVGFMVVVASVLLFPTRKFQPHWMWVFLLIYGGFALSLLYRPLNFYYYPAVFAPALLGFQVLTIVALLLQMRAVRTPAERQQSKWAIYGQAFTIIFVILGVFIGQATKATGVPQIIILGNIAVQITTTIAHLVGALGYAFSILRYRLWDIDLVINRSLVYGGLTLLLALACAAIYFAAQAALEGLLGMPPSPALLVIPALAIGVAFQPARRWLQHFVDRRFYGLLIDLEQMQARQRDQTRPGQFSGLALGRYQVGDVLGRGGMGEVYHGKRSDGIEEVAIKVLPPALAQDENTRQRFEREADLVRRLEHPNIIGLIDYGEQNGLLYLVMPYLRGQTLSKLIKQQGALTRDLCLAILRDLSAALDYAHDQGLVHRDVKPSNVMIEVDPLTLRTQATLMDFGVARLAEDQSQLTNTGIVGTLDYLAPEQIQAGTEIDRRLDIYALGVLAFQMFTGELPFKGSGASVMFNHLYQPAPDPRTIRPELPREVGEAILRAMAKKPEARFERASDFVAALGA